MAFSVIIARRLVSPFAVRFIAGHRFRHTAAVYSLSRRGNHSRQPRAWLAPATDFPSRRNFSASSNTKLLEMIESEIQCALDSSDQEEEAVEAPEDFPFKIEDISGENVITLEREYQGDTISVEVSMPVLLSGELDDNDNGKENDNENEENSSELSVPLVVRVVKKNGAVLEFTCTAFSDTITIDALSLKNPEISEEDIAYEGPDFSDLDENLQKAFHKYLEIRGVKPSTTNFLHEYMMNKNSKEYLKWLDGLKNFVEA